MANLKWASFNLGGKQTYTGTMESIHLSLEQLEYKLKQKWLDRDLPWKMCEESYIILVEPMEHPLPKSYLLIPEVKSE